jgi:hypothetical protein
MVESSQGPGAQSHLSSRDYLANLPQSPWSSGLPPSIQPHPIPPRALPMIRTINEIQAANSQASMIPDRPLPYEVYSWPVPLHMPHQPHAWSGGLGMPPQYMEYEACTAATSSPLPRNSSQHAVDYGSTDVHPRMNRWPEGGRSCK